MTGEEEKHYNPNKWGFVAGMASLAIFSITYATISFPDMLIHVFILPVVIGLILRWQMKLMYSNIYRDD